MARVGRLAAESAHPGIQRREFLQVGSSALLSVGLGVVFASRPNGVSALQVRLSSELRRVRALTFDVFGTVVDWRSSIIREGQRLTETKGIRVDWTRFADAWRAGYGPAMARVRSGDLPWTNIDGLHRMILDGLLEEFQIEGLSPDEVDHLKPGMAPPHAVARCGRGADAGTREIHPGHALERQHRPASQHGEERRAALGRGALVGAGRALQA